MQTELTMEQDPPFRSNERRVPGWAGVLWWLGLILGLVALLGLHTMMKN
jgi:hypothetical protein